MASVFGAAFDRLDRQTQTAYTDTLRHRLTRYSKGLSGERFDVKVILVGDKPGPGAKKLPSHHHHTPFYSTKNSSLWLNLQLLRGGIKETDLFWLNAADLNGVPTHLSHIMNWPLNSRIVALGGKAEKWLKTLGCEEGQYDKHWHPAAWKRFRSSEPYPLIEHLQKLCST